MSLISWAKKELTRLKSQSHKKLLPPPPTLKSSTHNCINVEPQIAEVVMVMDADLQCTKCQDRVSNIVSTMNDDLESIVVHVTEKKVTITRNQISS